MEMPHPGVKVAAPVRSTLNWLTQHPFVLVSIGLIGLIVLLWLPFGLNIPGTVEEWLRFNRFYEGRLMPSSGSNRFLVSTPYVLAYLLTPYSFIGVNLLHMAVLWWKGIALYALLRQLSTTPAVSFAAAALFVIYPSDTGLLSLRVLSIDVSLAALIQAMALLLMLQHKTRLPVLLVMVLCQLICLFIYEAGYAIFALTPLLLLWQERRLSKRVTMLSSIWYLAPLLTGLLLIFDSLTAETSYQSGLFEQAVQNPRLIADIVLHMGRAYEHNLVGSWWEVFTQVIPQQPASYWLIGTAAGGIAAGILLLLRVKPPSPLLIVMGLLLIGGAFIVYAFTPLRTESFRVFLYTAVGSAITVSAVAALVSVRFRSLQSEVFALIVGIFVGVAAVNALVTHAYWIEKSYAQQRVLARVIEQVPQLQNVQAIVVLDDTNHLISDVFPDSNRVEIPLRAIYDLPELQVFVCHLQEVANRFGEKCEFTPEVVRLLRQNPGRSKPANVKETAYTQALILRYTGSEVILMEALPPEYAQGSTPVGYVPAPLVCQDCPPPERVYSMFTVWKFDR